MAQYDWNSFPKNYFETWRKEMIDSIMAIQVVPPNYLRSVHTWHFPEPQGPAPLASKFDQNFKSYFGDISAESCYRVMKTGITGARAEMIIIDDPIADHNQETPMPTKKQKLPKKDYNTIGVRFIYGHNLNNVYTYLVPKKAKVHLGQEVIVPSKKDGTQGTIKSVAVVVEIHQAPQDTGPYEYLYVAGKVAPL